MMMLNLRAAALGLLLAGAAPVLAQMPPPPVGAPGMPAAAGKRGGDQRGDRMGGMFAGMSDAGKAMMRDAMKAGGDPRTEHEAVKAARDRMMTLLEADKLDTAALKRAMDDERRAAEVSREKRQAAMLIGFTKLSVTDRKAFVANARAMKTRMEQRMGKMPGGRGSMRGPGGPGGDMPPPPPM